MLLTEQNICYYLLDKGWLPLKQLVDGEFRADVSDSRNRNFIVNRDFENAYFIKHIKVYEADRLATMRMEATCYWLANNDDQYAALKPHLPVYHAFDYNNHILVLGYEKGCINLNDYYLRRGIGFLAIARQLGIVLGSYHHGITGELVGGKSGGFFRRQKPWIFTLTQVEKYLAQSGERKSEQQFFKLINDHGAFKDFFSTLEKEWDATALIHNDIKFTNFMIPADFESGESPALRLADWELADIGDPCWDTASLVQNYLSLWVSYEMDKTNPADFSLGRIQSAIRAFWEAYCGEMLFSVEQAALALLKTVNFSALKLVHTAYESMTGSEVLSPYTARLLQLSLNILQAPAAAQQAVFGM